MALKVGMLMAIVRVSDGKTMATCTIDKISDREIRTETPYEQLDRQLWELSRRYWRMSEPHTEMRIPKNEKEKRVPCFVREATKEDDAAAKHRVAVRQARERLPRLLRDEAEYERQIRLVEEQLQRLREPLTKVQVQINTYQALLIGAEED